MIWWLSQKSRLISEKAAVTELEGEVDWLQIGRWQTDSELSMWLEFKILHGEKHYSLKMRYPNVFPDTPPMIFTEDETLISLHQYGASGELCLEYRPDNWVPSITGADMVASCCRLLDEEHPDTGNVVHAHSAHIDSLGRDLRSSFCRFLMTEMDNSILNSLEENTPQTLRLNERFIAQSLVSSIIEVGEKDNPIWVSDLVLPEGTTNGVGLVIRIPEQEVQGITTLNQLFTLLKGVQLENLGETIANSNESSRLLIGNGNSWKLLWILGEGDSGKINGYKTVCVPPLAQRMPIGYDALKGKKIGVIGCGSLGSKVAASLCRSGISSFFLIDEDIFFPGNVVRNELDLELTGCHKAYALKERLQKLNPLCKVNALRISLGGQESSESMSGALETLGTCDLLIDATAEPVAFNLIASVSTRTKTPMIWCQVFAGGIGGYVSRARPDSDPIPIAARDQIQCWCEDQGVDWLRPDYSQKYVSQNSDGQPLIADDAEVSIIASHATRFASDILTRPEASIFPYSAYIIGLSSEWIFNEPFSVLPIDLQPTGEWGAEADSLTPEEMFEILKEHLPSSGEVNGADAAE